MSHGSPMAIHGRWGSFTINELVSLFVGSLFSYALTSEVFNGVPFLLFKMEYKFISGQIFVRIRRHRECYPW
ncbi:hypothetical protein DFP73DRAFT_568830 [Morchella snyderi]|nr:hypothetical protein DFP73DRAFT_568830 [Morchella snyderi]